LHADGSFIYTPNQHYNREDSFAYYVDDGTYRSEPVTVTLTVETAYPWYNGIRAVNVNDDKYVTPLDALLVINELNQEGSRKLPADRQRPLSAPFFDTSRDGFITPLDALLVINYLNRRQEGEGEGSTVRDAIDSVRLPWGPLFDSVSRNSNNSIRDSIQVRREPVSTVLPPPQLPRADTNIGSKHFEPKTWYEDDHQWSSVALESKLQDIVDDLIVTLFEDEE
jgi:hypothetical protein